MYQVVLFVHFLAIVLAFFATGIMHGAMDRLHRSQTIQSAREAVMQIGGASKLHPIATLLLFLTGAYLTQSAWTWGTPWIDCGAAALIVVAIMGGGVMGARERSLQRLLQETPGGAIPETVRLRLQDPLLAAGGTAIPFFVFAIIFVMVVKTNLAGSIAALITGAVLGTGIGLARLPSNVPAGAASEA